MPNFVIVIITIIVVMMKWFSLQFQVSAINETEEGHRLHSLTVDSLVQYVKDGVRKCGVCAPARARVSVYVCVRV